MLRWVLLTSVGSSPGTSDAACRQVRQAHPPYLGHPDEGFLPSIHPAHLVRILTKSTYREGVKVTKNGAHPLIGALAPAIRAGQDVGGDEVGERPCDGRPRIRGDRSQRRGVGDGLEDRQSLVLGRGGQVLCGDRRGEG